MSMQQILNELAVEAAVIEPAGGDNPDTLTVVTDETSIELDKTLAKLEEETKKGADDIDQLNKVADSVISTEAMVLEQLEYLSSESAANYNAGVQAAMNSAIIANLRGMGMGDDQVSVVFGDTESFEAADESAEKDANAKKGLLSRLMEMLKRAASALVNAAKRLKDVFVKSKEGNTRSADVLDTMVAGREGTPKEGKLKAESYKGLVVAGKVDAIAALKQLDSAYTGKLKPAQAKIVQVIDNIAKVLASGTKTGFIANLKKSLQSDNDGVQSTKVLNSFLESFPAAFDMALPGGREAKFEVVRSNNGGVKTKFDISAPKADVTGEIEPLTLAQVKAVAAAIRTNSKTLDQASKDLESTISSSEKVIAEAAALANSIADPADKPAIQAVVTASQSVIMSANSFVPKYSSVAVAVGNQAYALAKASASRYPKKAKAAKDAE